MKSKKAKCLLDSRRRFNEQGTEYHYDDVLDIIELAEQDAEERHAKEIEQIKENCLHLIVGVLKFIGTVSDERIEQLKERCIIELNGGQSYE